MFEVVAKAKREGRDITNLSIGEPDLDTHPSIMDKASKAMQDGFTHYSSNFGLEELRELIRKSRGFVYSTLRDMGLNSVKPEGAFYIFPEVPYNWPRVFRKAGGLRCSCNTQYTFWRG